MSGAATRPWHYRSAVVMERMLTGDLPLPPARLPVRVAPLAADELSSLALLRPELAIDIFHERLAQGHRCFAAWHEGRVVHAGWAAPRAAWIEFLDCAFPLADGDVYQYDSYTAPAARGMGVAALRVAWMARQLQMEGVRRLFAVVWPGNPAAFLPLEKVGYRRRGSIHVVRLGPWRRVLHTRSRSRQ